jgi:hypothetical protein
MEVKGIGEGIFKKIKMDLSLTEGVVSAPVKKVKKTESKKDTAKANDKNKMPNKSAKTKLTESAKKS